jgi:hypothetical protein
MTSGGTSVRRTGGRGGWRLGEAVEPLAVADHAVPLAGYAFNGGGVVEQRIAANPQPLDLGAYVLGALFLDGALAADAVELEDVVVPAEDGEVGRAHEEQGTEGEEQLHRTQNASRPGYSAVSPRSSAMRSSWLYLAMRSVRLALPVLIWPARVATARSAMKVSSVSPERWLMT